MNKQTQTKWCLTSLFFFSSYYSSPVQSVSLGLPSSVSCGSCVYPRCASSSTLSCTPLSNTKRCLPYPSPPAPPYHLVLCSHAACTQFPYYLSHLFIFISWYKIKRNVIKSCSNSEGTCLCKPVSSICSTVPWTSWCCCIRELQTVWGTLYLPMTTSFPACQSPLFLTDLLMDYTMCISLKCMFNSCRRTKGSEKSPVIRN